MTDSEIREKYNEVCILLANKTLKPAFDLLDQFISESGLGELRDEYEQLEQNYKYMLKYTVEGINDPERQKIYKHLLISTFHLADNTFENLRIKNSHSIEYQKKRGFIKQPVVSFESLLKELENYAIQTELRSLLTDQPQGQPNKPSESEYHIQKIYTLFYHLWFANRLTDSEIKFFKSFLKHDNFPFYEQSLIVTALSMSLMRYFDENKIYLLFDAYESSNEEVSQRALISILIGIYQYDQRMPFYHEITGRLEILSEDPRFRANLEQVILQFIRSKETEKIQRKLQDEIIPEMIKLSPNIRNKLSIESLFTEGLSEDKNPQWQEILKDTPGLIEKMEELTKMQMEGADVFMSSFSMLKQFPFFSEFANWFIPFTPDHPEIKKNPINKEAGDDIAFSRLIMQSPMLCNSDKYSFFFSIINIPPDYKNMVSETLKAESEQFEEIAKDQSYLAHNKKAEIVISQYIRDLYRFFRIHPQRTDFEDIFSWKFDFHNKYAFSKLLSEDPKIQRRIAEFYFAKNYFDEASELYELLLQKSDDPELLQKFAFCFQKMGNYKKALNNYLKADLFDLNKQWNLKKIALCYRNLKKPAKALEYYQQAEILEPENLNLLVSIGQCQMELKNYEEALKSYYKVEYLLPGNIKIWRPIGWCSFLLGKIDQALKYYQQIIDQEPNKYDLLNMGHVQWCLGNRKTALEYYKRSIKDSDNSEKEFMEAFEEDLQHLIEQGVNPDDVSIMLDQLRYSLED